MQKKHIYCIVICILLFSFGVLTGYFTKKSYFGEYNQAKNLLKSTNEKYKKLEESYRRATAEIKTAKRQIEEIGGLRKEIAKINRELTNSVEKYRILTKTIEQKNTSAFGVIREIEKILREK
jgi:peptidoglycan hydrolase CwlO-like protein